MARMTRTLALLCSLGLLVAPGCRRVSQRVLRDTENRALSARCDRDQHCTLEQTAGPTVGEQANALVLRSVGALVGVCNTAPSASEPGSPSDCRPLVCQTDADCPPSHGAKDGSCVNSLCREPSNPLTVDDAVMLCLAGTGLGKDLPDQVARYAMALNCGQPCKIPTPCRQP
jgi:hypothetical protein